MSMANECPPRQLQPDHRPRSYRRSDMDGVAACSAIRALAGWRDGYRRSDHYIRGTSRLFAGCVMAAAPLAWSFAQRQVRARDNSASQCESFNQISLGLTAVLQYLRPASPNIPARINDDGVNVPASSTAIW